MPAIRVLIEDDDPVTRGGLHATLDQTNDVVVVGEADSHEMLVDLAAGYDFPIYLEVLGKSREDGEEVFAVDCIGEACDLGN